MANMGCGCATVPLARVSPMNETLGIVGTCCVGASCVDVFWGVRLHEVVRLLWRVMSEWVWYPGSVFEGVASHEEKSLMGEASTPRELSN